MTLIFIEGLIVPKNCFEWILFSYLFGYQIISVTFSYNCGKQFCRIRNFVP